MIGTVGEQEVAHLDAVAQKVLTTTRTVIVARCGVDVDDVAAFADGDAEPRR